MRNRIVAIGTEAEVAHHVRPFAGRFDIECLPPDQAGQELMAGDLAIFYSEHFERFRRCVGVLRERKVASLYMVDGILEWRNAWENRADEPACPWTMRPVLSDKVACIGPAQARTLAAWGNRQKLEITGIPRLDSLTLAPAGPREAGVFHVLVVTAKFPGFTPGQVAVTLQSLRDLLAAGEGMTVAGRRLQLHWRIAGSLASQLAVPNRINDLTGMELAQQLQTVDAVITTPSTTMLEAMRVGLPVALLDYHGCPQYVPAAWQISHAGQISEVLQQLAQPAAARMDYQRQILADQLLISEPATERMSQLIERMSGLAREFAGNGQAPVFPADLLPAPSAASAVLDHSLLFPSQAEFRESAGVETLAELAHCRRELRHLENVIAGLRDELGQAHAIFDQIHRHPVAGPIVRIRQRLLDLAGKWRGPRPEGEPGVSVPEETRGGETCGHP